MIICEGWKKEKSGCFAKGPFITKQTPNAEGAEKPKADKSSLSVLDDLSGQLIDRIVVLDGCKTGRSPHCNPPDPEPIPWGKKHICFGRNFQKSKQFVTLRHLANLISNLPNLDQMSLFYQLSFNIFYFPKITKVT